MSRRQNREPNQIDAALAEAKHSTKPLLVGATLAEVVAAGATIASKLPVWSLSGILVGVPLAAFAYNQNRKAVKATKQLVQLYHYDRRYHKYVTSWSLTASENPDYWTGIHHAERHFTAIRPVRYFTWNVTRRSDDDLPFDAAEVRNKRASRSASGSCIFHDFHKQKANLTFRIEFDPPLRPEESVDLAFDVIVPRHKVSNIELLRSRPRPKIPLPEGLDYSSTDISYPIEKFVKSVDIDERLGTIHHGLQVLLQQDEFLEEKAYLSSGNRFTIDRAQVDGNSVVRLKIERDRPPIGTTYRLTWEPPARKVIGAN